LYKLEHGEYTTQQFNKLTNNLKRVTNEGQVSKTVACLVAASNSKAGKKRKGDIG